MSRTAIIIAVVLVLLGIVAVSSVFTVHETQQALVLQFGEPKRVVRESGLHFKLPLVQNVLYLEKRILDFDASPMEVIVSDKKRLVVDTYARFRIDDPLQFYQSVGTESGARARLRAIIEASQRRVLAKVDLQAVLSGERAALMRQISENVNEEANTFGVNVVDVRIKRADLPAENSQAIYQRMESEREREAREIRARGAEEAQKIQADADRQKAVLLAQARKQAEILRGGGDARRQQIFIKAFGEDPEFFSYYRSLEAYRTALQSEDTTLVLSPDSEFFRYFGSGEGTGTTIREAGSEETAGDGDLRASTPRTAADD